MLFKRGIAAMLAAVTVLGLAGCGGSEEAATEGTENTEIYLTQRCLCWITQNNAALRVEFTEWSLATLRLAMRGVALNG